MGHAMEMISRVARLPHETGLYYKNKPGKPTTLVVG